VQKSFHVQPYPLWALWIEPTKDQRLGRVIGWVALCGEDDRTYPVVHVVESGLTESLHAVDYDLLESPDEAAEKNGWTDDEVAAGVKSVD